MWGKKRQSEFYFHEQSQNDNWKTFLFNELVLSKQIKKRDSLTFAFISKGKMTILVICFESTRSLKRKGLSIVILALSMIEKFRLSFFTSQNKSLQNPIFFVVCCNQNNDSFLKSLFVLLNKVRTSQKQASKATATFLRGGGINKLATFVTPFFPNNIALVHKFFHNSDLVSFRRKWSQTAFGEFQSSKIPTLLRVIKNQFFLLNFITPSKPP